MRFVTALYRLDSLVNSLLNCIDADKCKIAITERFSTK